ncbi:MAG: kelch repeat-containing protein [bacterium]
MGDVPEARDGHSSCKISGKIYIFGGQGNND